MSSPLLTEPFELFGKYYRVKCDRLERFLAEIVRIRNEQRVVVSMKQALLAQGRMDTEREDRLLASLLVEARRLMRENTVEEKAEVSAGPD